MRQPRNGMSILAVLTLVSGIISFVGAIVLMLGGAVGTIFGEPLGGTATGLGAAMLGVSVASFVLGYGFWASHSWAWSGAFVVYGVSIVVNVLTVVLVGASPLAIVLPVAISAGVMWMLLKPSTKATLRGPAPVAAKA